MRTAPLSGTEALSAVKRRVEKYINSGACEACAIRIASHELDIPQQRVAAIWIGVEPR